LSSYRRILIRATNWVGDAVMSLPAARRVRECFPEAHIAVLARASVAGIYERERWVDEVIPLASAKGRGDWAGKWRTARELAGRGFDCALLLQNAFEAAALVWAARIPVRIGYNRDGRGWLLTDAIAVPKRGEIARHERFYYLELLKRAGWIRDYPADGAIRLEGAVERIPAGPIGISPGAAYGGAKRWLPERFAEAAIEIARQTGAAVALFGAPSERPLCEEVAERIRRAGVEAHDYAGETSLAEFIRLAATCRIFLTNDSGAMHIASALGVPSVTVFGATDEIGTGPTGERARVVREPVDCAPCLLRECPTDHRCMTRVEAGRVAQVALKLLK
jgi:heptosyltransferase-2